MAVFGINQILSGEYKQNNFHSLFRTRKGPRIIYFKSNVSSTARFLMTISLNFRQKGKSPDQTIMSSGIFAIMLGHKSNRDVAGRLRKCVVVSGRWS